MWTVSAFQQHSKTLMICDEDATLVSWTICKISSDGSDGRAKGLQLVSPEFESRRFWFHNEMAQMAEQRLQSSEVLNSNPTVSGSIMRSCFKCNLNLMVILYIDSSSPVAVSTVVQLPQVSRQE